jgi:hypothetical protein
VIVVLLACLAYPLAQGYSALRNVNESAGLAEGDAEALALAPWFDKHIGRHEAVIANDGQFFGYWYDRPTVALIRMEYSHEPWTEEKLRRVARTYGARCLVLFDGDEFEILKEESPFLLALKGDGRPGWVRLVASGDNCQIFRLAPDGP